MNLNWLKEGDFNPILITANNAQRLSRRLLNFFRVEVCRGLWWTFCSFGGRIKSRGVRLKLTEKSEETK
jgi:hypothetical protein